jgi:flagellar biosynthesis protein FlhB
MQTDQEERTLPPTELGLEKARRRGQVARSGDLCFAVLLGGWALVSWSGPRLVDKARAMLVQLLQMADPLSANPAGGVWSAVAPLAIEVGILMLAAVGVAVLVNLLQVGLRVTTEPVEPNLSRISPLTGLRRMFSLRSGQRLAMVMIQLVVVGWIFMGTIGPEIARICQAARGPVPELLQCAGDVLGGALLKCAVAMLVLAGLDYLYQRWQHHRDLRISPRQFREELKQLEGDPNAKQLRRRHARRMLGQQIQREIPRVTAVITDDRGLAVAIRFEPSQRWPLVSAKAAGTLGRRMIQLAVEHGRCVVENASLARSLYRHCQAGRPVMRKHLDEVAEIVAYARQIEPRSLLAGENPQAAHPMDNQAVVA